MMCLAVIPFTASAGPLPADWDCVQSYNQIPRNVATGHFSVLDNIKTDPVIKKRTPIRVLPFDLQMVRISPGHFKLGSPSTEQKRERFEGPQQTVSIEYSFEIGKYEVSFNQWSECVLDGGCGRYNPPDAGWGRSNRPAINVSWDDAQLFISWLNQKTGRFYRLPSEAEWEYVARAGTVTPFYTGTMISSADANFNGTETYNGSPYGTYLRKTTPAGRYSPNPFGVYDILGNAYEWTQDCWNDSHVGNSNDGLPRGDGDCKFRVMKGGSWVSFPDHVRAAKRTRYVTNYRYDDYGFRLARTVK